MPFYVISFAVIECQALNYEACLPPTRCPLLAAAVHWMGWVVSLSQHNTQVYDTTVITQSFMYLVLAVAYLMYVERSDFRRTHIASNIITLLLLWLFVSVMVINYYM